MKKLLNEGNKMHNFYCVCENFCDSILLKVSVHLWQKVPVPSVPVPVQFPKHWQQNHLFIEIYCKSSVRFKFLAHEQLISPEGEKVHFSHC
jgi:hypothetical protein